MARELRILVPLDGSKESEFVLSVFAPLYRSRPVHFTLLGVAGRHEATSRLGTYLETVHHGLVLQGVATDLKLEIGSPAGEILSLARTGRFDLLAMTAHGRSGVREFIPGSVAEEVIHRADLPVLMSRPMGRRPAWDRFLVALDGSAAAEEILPEALRVVRMLGASLQIVRPATSAVPSEARLREIGEAAARQGVRTMSTLLPESRPLEVIRYAEAQGVGLICLAAPGGTGLSRLAVGNTAELLLHGAPCALFVRRPARAALAV